METRTMLLIVDPQVDFIVGSLKVPGAEWAMDYLSEYVRLHAEKYDRIAVTCDFHPTDHSSFTEQGGPWPPHCVKSTVGAAVWPPLMAALLPLSDKVAILYKGTDRNHDEYSIFKNPEGARMISSLIMDNNIGEIEICGLAGDVCVKNTLEDAESLFPNIYYRILGPCTASLDSDRYIKKKIGSLINSRF